MGGNLGTKEANLVHDPTYRDSCQCHTLVFVLLMSVLFPGWGRWGGYLLWWVHNIHDYYIDTDEIPGFLLLLKNHIFTEDTISVFHVWGYWCGHGYQHNYPVTIELLAQARGRLIWNFIHKMASRCEDGRVIEFFSLLEFWLFQTENVSIIFFISPL